MKPKLLSCGGALLAGLFAASGVGAEITLDSLLREMTDYDAVAQWPEPEFTCRQASSYDRARISPDKPNWFANRDFTQYIRSEEREGRKEQVMMDAEGPGAIVRFWITTGKQRAGTLRIYLDGAALPALTFGAYDLMAGDLKLGPPLLQPHPGYQPDNRGGTTLYLPIPYAKHCEVTWEEGSKDSRYYQINYRTYPAGTPVRTFTRAALDPLRPAIETIGRAMLAPPLPVSGAALSCDRLIPGHSRTALELPPGPAALRSVELRARTDDPALLERALRSLVVQMRFDQEDTVWCPVSDFFGCGVGMNPLQSWYRTALTNGVLSCRWVMPYRKAGTLFLTNLSESPVAVTLKCMTGPWRWDDRSMHFYCSWHHEAGLATPPPRDWNYISITGRGVYVGDTLALFNPVATWYGEGNEKIWVDGESFPSHLGTGTEDYYGFSYAPKGVHHTPFTGEPRLERLTTQGHTTLTRTRNLDGIPFHRSLKFDMELISWKPTTLTYAATTYWYALPGCACNVLPQPAAAASPVAVVADPLP